MAEQQTKEKETQTMEDQSRRDQQMCCEGGMTAAEHRAKSPNGKCCTD